MQRNSCIQWQRIKWNQTTMYALCMCVVTKKKNFQNSRIFHATYHHPTCMLSAVFCDHTCSHFQRIKELITDGKVNGKKGRVRQTSLILFWSISRTPYITVIQRKSLTDRYIQPQLSAFALDALFICVPIWRNPPNSPAGSKKTRSARERKREKERQAD